MNPVDVEVAKGHSGGFAQLWLTEPIPELEAALRLTLKGLVARGRATGLVFGTRVIESQTGVQPGNPLGPLLLALAIFIALLVRPR